MAYVESRYQSYAPPSSMYPQQYYQQQQQQQQQSMAAKAYAYPAAAAPMSAPSSSRQQQQLALPSKLEFFDATTLLTFMSSLPSPTQLLTVTDLRITLPSSSPSSPSRAQIAMAIHLMLRYTHNLTSLNLSWTESPSSVLTAVSFRLTSFSSTLFVDATVISFLESQPTIRTLELGGWGAHLPPQGTHPSNYSSYGPAPPMLTPTALPALVEFTGHAEVAAQLAQGGRPIQAVHLISGLPSPLLTPGSAALSAEWREIMSGLAGSSMGIRSLSVVGMERFGLEMLAEVGRHLHDLDYLFVRVARPLAGSVSDAFRWEHWKNYLLPLAQIEQIDIELFDASAASSNSSAYPAFAPITLPSLAHIQSWQNTCPLLANVTVAVADIVRGRTGELCDWEWRGGRHARGAELRWVEKVSGASSRG
ncbi:hypothetical protein DL93DRAFT_2170574 [Clavulina sp. PMI_390]|nr:hypothetical protein DL93DRAFT_2170574 [Clavulina sp. PMI_390]